MKKGRRIGIILFTILLLFQFKPMQVEASSVAAFYVQTAAILEDNTIEVCVYLDEVDNLGGIDLELVYDSEKVSFVRSSLGASLQSSLSDMYHDAEKGSIRCVVLYSEPKSAHGILLRVVFQLKQGQSYQPQLVINDLVDNTTELNDIPYTIQYQQADGIWSDTQDTSGEAADDVVIEDVLNEYGAPEDLENRGEETVTVDSENQMSGVTTETEEIVVEEDSTESAENSIEGTETAQEAETTQETETIEDTEISEIVDEDDGIQRVEDESSDMMSIVLIGIISVIICIFGVLLRKQNRKNKF